MMDVATVSECEACFTPDACRLRGTCDHYAASKLRIAAAPSAPASDAREAFERWHRSQGYEISDMLSPLDLSMKALMWQAWSAATDAARESAPAPAWRWRVRMNEFGDLSRWQYSEVEPRWTDDMVCRERLAPSAPAEVPMPEPDMRELDPYVAGKPDKVLCWYSPEALKSYAAAREAAERERVRGVLRNLVEHFDAYRGGWIGHDVWRDRIGLLDDLAAARAELGEKT